MVDSHRLYAPRALMCSGAAFGLACVTVGTWRPHLQLWYFTTFVKEYNSGLLAKISQCHSASELWEVLLFRGATLRRVLKLEVDHQVAIIQSGGRAAVEEDPTRLWKNELLHPTQPTTPPPLSKEAQKAKEAAALKAKERPVLKDLVLVGGGHTHAHVLMMMGMDPIPGVRVTLITRDVETPYSGMLPGYIAGVYTKRECHIDLARLGRFANARVIHARVTGIDTVQQRINLSSCLDDETNADAKARPSMRYDALSIDVGCSPSFFQGSGYDAVAKGDVLSNVTTVKPIDAFADKYEALVESVKDWHGSKEIVVVGGGAGGVEVCLSLQTRLQARLRELGRSAESVRLSLICRSTRVTPNHHQDTSNIFANMMQKRGIQVYLEHSAQGVEADGGKEFVACSTPSGQRRVPFDHAFWCTDGAAQTWMKDIGLETDEAGFLVVEQTLQARRRGTGEVMANVFAAGDCSTIRGHPRPKAGVFAVMAGMPLSKNVRAIFENKPLEKFLPQKEFLGIIGTGDGGAVASKAGVAFTNEWLWSLKDWIDRTWMYKYSDGLPKMGGDDDDPGEVAKIAGKDALELMKHATMRCGGCGSKVGSTVLSDAIERLKVSQGVHQNEQVLMGIDSPDDAAVVRQHGSKLVTVQTVDFFKAIVSDPYVFGRLAALHALSDCFAMGAQAQTALALVTVPLGSNEVMSEDLFHMMAGANRELQACSCTLAGGHTTEGPEAAFGLCVTGIAEGMEDLMTKGVLNPGDKLLLTKPLGTGCIFAGEMQQEARGHWVSGALRWMLRSNEPAAKLLRSRRSLACTDVTGFGLLGHLVEMAKAAKGVSVNLWLDEVPALDGAVELLNQGVASSLQPSNTRLRRALFNEVQAAEHFASGKLPKYPLLFDPQTNGGLLAAVPADKVSSYQQDFAKANISTWIIGEVVARPLPENGKYVTLVSSSLV